MHRSGFPTRGLAESLDIGQLLLDVISSIVSVAESTERGVWNSCSTHETRNLDALTQSRTRAFQQQEQLAPGTGLCCANQVAPGSWQISLTRWGVGTPGPMWGRSPTSLRYHEGKLIMLADDGSTASVSGGKTLSKGTTTIAWTRCRCMHAARKNRSQFCICVPTKEVVPSLPSLHSRASRDPRCKSLPAARPRETSSVAPGNWPSPQPRNTIRPHAGQHGRDSNR
jgi:hypothetical protein